MLTEIAIKAARPTGKPYKLSDERGMYLLVNAEGAKYWRLDYRIDGKRKTLALGVHPDVPLKTARERRDGARALVAKGIDPSSKRKAEKLAADNSVEAIAREWFAKFSPKWAKGHADKIIRRLERDVFPWIGAKPIDSIKAPELLTVIRRIEARGAIETAHRAMQNCSRVFRYAVATGRAERDVTTDLRGALPPATSKNLAAITEPARIGELLRAMDGYVGAFTTRSALLLSPLVFLRPGELRHGEWTEIDLTSAEWRIPASRMKMGEPHIVPLSKQAIAILRELKPWTGSGKYIFPSARSAQRPMSENAILAALRRMGYGNDDMTGHGFRAMARTVLDEVLGQRVDWIEHQLAHAVKDANGRAYNRTAHLPQRHKMMQTWADYLDKLRTGKVPSAEESGKAG
jgi:integrase